jgi:hypothetical protein
VTWIRREGVTYPTPHRCELPPAACLGDIWECDEPACGWWWTYRWGGRSDLGWYRTSWFTRWWKLRRRRSPDGVVRPD